MKRGHLIFMIILLGASCGTTKTKISQMKAYWDYPYTINYVSLDEDQEVAYVDEGEGPQTILMIHGLGSYLPAWQKMIKQLEGQYRCIALDLPGYGQSKSGDYDYSMSFFAETVQSFIKKLKLKNVILMGHSMGGQIAIKTVLNGSTDIKQLILLAPAGFETFSEKDHQFFSQFVTPAILKAATDEQIKQNFAVNFYGNQLPEDAQFMYDDRLKLKENVTHYDDYVNMIPKCVIGMLNEPVFDQLDQINLPTLIFYGENDGLIPNKYLHPKLTTQGVAEAGQQAIPNSKLIMVPECGHFVLWDQTQFVSDAIQQFINQ